MREKFCKNVDKFHIGKYAFVVPINFDIGKISLSSKIDSIYFSAYTKDNLICLFSTFFRLFDVTLYHKDKTNIWDVCPFSSVK